MDFFKNFRGESKEKKIVNKIVNIAVNQHDKIIVKRKDGTVAAHGLLNSIEKEKLIFLLRNRIDMKDEDFEISFFLSGYVFYLKHRILPIDSHFYYIPIPGKFKYKRRDVRIHFCDFLSRNELPAVYADRGENVKEQIGNVLDISRNGMGYKPNSIFKSMGMRINSKIKNIHFELGGKMVILDEVQIKNFHSDLIGVEFREVSNHCKKMISDFIIDYIRDRDKQEKEEFIRKNFPNLIPDDMKEKKQVKGKKRTIYHGARVDAGKKRVLLFDYENDLAKIIKKEFLCEFHQNIDQARVSLIKKKPDVVLSCVYPAKNSTDKLKWLNFINEIKKRKIPLILVVDQIISKDSLIRAVKMFGVQDVLVKHAIAGPEVVYKKIYRLTSNIRGDAE